MLSGDSVGSDDVRRWLLVRREIDVPDVLDGAGRWSVDHLFLDQDAVPTLVEVKRSSDTRIRREVVGQMLDYAANAVVYWPVDKIRMSFELRCASQGLDPAAEVARLLGYDAVDGVDSEAEAFWQKVKTNLQAGRVRLVFVADVIPPELRRVVEFLNEQMDPAEVLAIEIRQYIAGGLRTLVPTVVGQTAEAQRRKSTSPRASRQWDETSFFEELERTSSPQVVWTARALLNRARQQGCRIWWGKGSQMGSFIPILDRDGAGHQLFGVWTYGSIEFQFYYLAMKAPFSNDIRRQELLDRLNAIPGVSIPSDTLRRRPSIPLSNLANEQAVDQLIAVFDWWLAETLTETPAV